MWPGTDTLIYIELKSSCHVLGWAFQEHKALHFSALWKGPTQAASPTLDHFLSVSDHPYFLPSKLAWCRYHSLKTWTFMWCLFSFFWRGGGSYYKSNIKILEGEYIAYCVHHTILVLVCIFEICYHKNSATWSLQKMCTWLTHGEQKHLEPQHPQMCSGKMHLKSTSFLSLFYAFVFNK